MNLQILVLELLLAAFTAGKKYTKSNDAVLLSKVRSLTLQNGKQTTARRVTPIPQLTCIGGSGKGYYDVDVMRCENSGSEYDAEDIQWTCKANLPAEFKLGSTDVVCEGYDSSEDPYILKGSCGVEYRLILTEMGEEKYGKGGWFKPKPRVQEFNPPKSETKSESKIASSKQSFGSMLFSIVFWLAFIGIVCLILRSIWRDHGQGGRPPAPRNPIGGGGFWGGGGGDDDPPPPYTPRAPPRPKAAPRSQPRSQPSSSTPRSSRSTNSGPGFWTGAGVGAAGGAAGGYAAGQYAANRRHEEERAHEQERIRQQSMFGAGPSNLGQGGSSWFGGGGGGNSGAGSSSAPSTGRYESTGFGGTRRR